MVLNEQIPDDFYKIFASKYRPTYFAYLVAIYDALTDYASAHGVTVSDLRSIVYDIPCVTVDGNDEEDTLDTPFQTVRLNRLFEFGWLTKKYDASRGEDVVTLPEYSKLFVRVMKELTSDRKRNLLSIRSAYASVHAYKEKRDIGLLQDAHDMLHDMNIGLLSYLDRREKEIGSMMALSNGMEMIKRLLEELRAEQGEDGVSESSEGGRISMYHGELLRDLNLLIEQCDLENEATKEAQLSLFRLLKDIRAEAVSAKTAFDAVIARSAEMCIRALARIKYLSGGHSEDALSRLAQSIRYLHKAKETDDEVVLNIAADIFSFPMEPDALLDHDIYMPRIAGDSMQEFESIPDEDPPVSQYCVNMRYSDAELSEFLATRTSNGTFRANQQNICTDQDLDMLITLFFKQLGTVDSAASIDIGDYVQEDDFGFSALSWEVKH